MPLRAILWLAVSTEAQADDEKNSLPTQQKEARELVDREGWKIVDTLEVPGHSRRFIDIHECARAMREKGINAFDKLLSHWEARDFDVLIVRDSSRFARTQALNSYVVEQTIEIGARIYSLADGWIDQGNYRMWISMSGYSAATEIDNLKKRRKFGFDARVNRGLPANHSVPSSHRIVRDPHSGDAKSVELDESKLQMWRDLATLILEGLSWRAIHTEMYDRFGYTNELGEPFNYPYFYRLVTNPGFWGHIARNFKKKSKGPWIFEEGEPMPEGVEVHYNMWSPVWTGDLAERIKSELRRRMEVIKGRAQPEETKPFTGLFICGGCTYNLTYASKGSWQALRCMSRYSRSATRPDCDQTTSIPIDMIKEYIDSRLREMVELGDPSAFFPKKQEMPLIGERLVGDLRKEITQLENQVRKVIRDKADAEDDIIRGIYDDEIKSMSDKLIRLKKRLKEAEQEKARYKPHVQRRAFEEIVDMSVDTFWEQSDGKINQLLHRLIGDKRFVVLNGVIIGVADKPVRQRRY